MSEGQPRLTVRGGRDKFSWESIKNDKHHSHYLGASIKASHGRWQENKDLEWFSKPPQNETDEVIDIERRMMDEALSGIGNANTVPVEANRAVPIRDTKQGQEIPLLEGRKERDRRSDRGYIRRRSRDRGHSPRDQSRSRERRYSPRDKSRSHDRRYIRDRQRRSRSRDTRRKYDT